MFNDVDLSAYEKITAKTYPEYKGISSGHRACQGCVEVLAMSMVMKAAGPNTIACNATGCMEIISSPYPQTAWNVPWLHVAFENAGAVASGIEAASKVMMAKGAYKKQPNIIAFAGDGATADIGLQSLSGAMERGHNMLYVCLDNEAYMNTGIQRSSSTPFGAMTTTSPPGKKSMGQATWKKDMPAIIAAHGVPYVATAMPAYHLDLVNKVRKALAAPGPAYLHVFATCPTGWGIKPEIGVSIGKLAAATGVFPLYEVVGGRYNITQKTKQLKPVEEYLKIQRRFKHLGEKEIAHIQEMVDKKWAWLNKLAEISKEPEEEEA